MVGEIQMVVDLQNIKDTVDGILGTLKTTKDSKEIGQLIGKLHKLYFDLKRDEMQLYDDIKQD